MNITLPSQYDFLFRLFRLALLNIVSNITEPLAGAISLAFLGHLSEIHHLAGASLSTTLFNFIYFIVSFLRAGTTGVTAQAMGRDDTEEMLLVGLRNSVIALIVGGLLLLLQYPLQQLWFSLISTTPEMKASGIDYFNARIWGAPAVAVNFVLIGWFLGREMSGFVLLVTLVGNTANIAFDYLFVVQWDWASTGAGLSGALSQYLMLVLGLVKVAFNIDWEEAKSAARRFWDTSDLKAVFILNGNILIKSLASMFVVTIFTALSSGMGTVILTENFLLLQVVFFCEYIFEGLGFATETLGGNFKGQQASERLLPLLRVTVGSSILMGIFFAAVCILFPQTVFGLLTNHREIKDTIQIYVPWLLSTLLFFSVIDILEGYFAGLAEGKALRNSALIGASLGFVPLAGVVWHSHNNHILWLAVSVWEATRVLVLVMQLPETLKDEPALIAE